MPPLQGCHHRHHHARIGRATVTSLALWTGQPGSGSRGTWFFGYPSTTGVPVVSHPWPARDLSDYLPKWSDPVASVCDVCGKGPGFGNNVSHSHRRTPRRWNPNIQRVRAMVGKTPRRLNVCTSCIKAGKVTR
jgi:large subunit ribosomal protein L28